MMNHKYIEDESVAQRSSARAKKKFVATSTATSTVLHLSCATLAAAKSAATRFFAADRAGSAIVVTDAAGQLMSAKINALKAKWADDAEYVSPQSWSDAQAEAEALALAQARAEAEALALAEAEKARAAAEAEQIVIREMPERGIVCTVDRSAVVYVNGHAATEPRRLPSGEYFVWAPKAAGLPLGVKIMLSQQVISKIEAHAAAHYAAEAAHLAGWRATTKQAQAHNNSQNEGREGFNRYYD